MSIKNLDALKNYFCYTIVLITVLYHCYNTVITHKVFLPFAYELYTTRIKKLEYTLRKIYLHFETETSDKTGSPLANADSEGSNPSVSTNAR